MINSSFFIFERYFGWVSSSWLTIVFFPSPLRCYFTVLSCMVFDKKSEMAQMVKNLPAVQETQVESWVGKISWRRKCNLFQYSGKSCGQRSLVGYSPWGHKESDITEQRTLYFFHCNAYFCSLVWNMSLLYWLQDFLIVFFCSFNMIQVGILLCIISLSFGYGGGSIYVAQCFLNCWISGLILWSSLINFGYSFFKYFFCLFTLSFPLGFHWHVCQTILYHS